MELPAQRIAVTGGAGFLGAHVVARLRQRDCQHIFVPRSKDYDLREASAVARLFEDLRPDVVVHLAAVVGGIGANRANPGRFFYDNAIMGIQMMEFARRAAVKKFVAVGTICSYPKFTPVPFNEDYLWNGYPEETNAPYGLAKKMLLVQCQSYREQYGFNGVYLLPVNLYGPGDNFDLDTSHVIPAIIRKFQAAIDHGQREVVLWGDGSPTREFLHVRDAARGIVLAAARYDGAEPVNLGTNHEIRIDELAEMIRGIMGFEGSIVWDSSKPNGQPRRCLSVTRAERAFGFKAAVSLEDGLRETVQWYRRLAHAPLPLSA